MKLKQLSWFILIKLSQPKTVNQRNWFWKYIFEPKLDEYNSLLRSKNRNQRFYELEKFLCEKFVTVKNFSYKEFTEYKYIPSNIKSPELDWEFTDEEVELLLTEIQNI